MNSGALIGIIDNIILLLALGVVYEIVPLERPRMGYPRQVLQGLVIGLLAVMVMLNPWQFSPGIIVDTRSVLLSIAGLFWGLVPATVAALVAALLRLVQGGAGAWTGVAVIVTSAALGIVWRWARPGKSKPPGWGELYLFGLVVHIAMLLWMLALPAGVSGPVLQAISAPVLLFYPPATAVLGKILARQAARRETDARYRLLVDLSPYAIGVHQDGRVVFANRAAARLLGAEHPDQLLGRSVQEIVHPDGLAEAIDRIQRMLKGETGLYPVDDRYVRLDGRVVDVEVTAAPFIFRGRPAVQVIALDISARKQAEQSVRRYTRRLEILRQIDRGILEARSREQIIRAVLDHIRALIPCRRASVLLFDTAGEQCQAYGFVVDQERVVHENRILPIDPTALPVWQNRQVDKV
ncbi:MAG: PAS domain S-box protein, partial [Chloroflexi bacterium]